MRADYVPALLPKRKGKLTHDSPGFNLPKDQFGSISSRTTSVFLLLYTVPVISISFWTCELKNQKFYNFCSVATIYQSLSSTLVELISTIKRLSFSSANVGDKPQYAWAIHLS